MLKSIKTYIVNNTLIFDAIRWILENGYKGEIAIIRKEIASLDGKVLDLGCGTGIFAKYFNPLTYCGIDSNNNYIASALYKNKGYKFMHVDAQTLPFSDNHFDVCFVSGVFHHMNNQVSDIALREVSRVLKEKGKLFVWEDIETVNKWNIIGRIIHHYDEGDHIRTIDKYREMFNNVFFIEKEYFMRSGFMDYVVFHCDNTRHE
jgi:ubiquinone/menaquinone biosynthesis C-methylase UbiE